MELGEAVRDAVRDAVRQSGDSQNASESSHESVPDVGDVGVPSESLFGPVNETVMPVRARCCSSGLIVYRVLG